MPAPKAIAPQRSPSFWLPLAHFLLGITCLGIGMLGLAVTGADVLGSSWNPRLLALTHLFTLGWVLPMIMGASYQMIPVVLHSRVASEPLAELVLGLYTTGLLALLAGFWTLHPFWLATGGSTVLVAITGYLVNVGLSLRRATAWNLQGTTFLTALGFLSLAALLGWSRALGLGLPSSVPTLGGSLAAHVQAATIGCVSLLIFGVSYRLVPMFALAHGRVRFDRAALFLTASGVLMSVTGHLIQVDALVRLGALGMALGACLWSLDMVQLYRSSKARKLDPGLAYSAIAVGYLLAATAMGTALAFGWLPPGVEAARWTLAYGVLGLIGWISNSITGQFHRIMPFLAWYHRYSKVAGRKKAPLLKDLFDPRIGWCGFWAFQAGVVMLVASVMTGRPTGVQVAAISLLGGVLATAAMIGQTLRR